MYETAVLAYQVEIQSFRMNVGGAEEMVPIALRVTTIFRRDRRESPSVYMHLLPDHAERNAAKVERFLNGATA